MQIVSPFKANVLENKVAFVTGGGSGIGLAIATQFGLHGAKVAIMGRSADRLKSALATLKAAGVEAFSFAGDVRSGEQTESAVAAVVKHFGRLDILVNCAAGNFMALTEDLSPNAFKTVVDIDLIGTFNMSRAALPHLKVTRGSIINITATLHYGATPYVVHASAAKAGVDALTRGMATEWHEYGIRVNGVAPGPIRDTTGMDKLRPLSGDVSGSGSSNQFQNSFIREGEKDEIALTCVFLCTSAANYINAETVVVDGGTWMLKPSLPKTIYEQYVKRKPTSKL